ncbi:MAG: plastocyanin/azurin family copper-binding protein [Thaumarchaeota archaeon]|nr:plastocyanin/azurin family copper-binding protein [Nitrososphaerota archaeon]
MVTVAMVAVMAAFLTSAPFLAGPAFAGEAGSASSRALFINDRYVAAEVAADPPILREGEERISLEVVIHDVDADPPVPVSDVSYNLVIRTGGDVLLDLDVYSPSDVSVIGIMPDASGDVTVVSRDEPDASGAWVASPDEPLLVRAPVFLEGGPVDVSITLQSMEGEPVLAEGSTLEVPLSMGQFIPFAVEIGGVQTDFVFATYHDRIEGFEYYSRQKSITATMPFDWDESTIGDVSFVHAEYYIPKTVKMFEDHDILLAVSGVPYFGTVDRSSDDSIVVHFLLSSSKLAGMLASIPEDERDVMTFTIASGKERQKEKQDASLEGGDTVVVTSSREDWKFYVWLEPPGGVVQGRDLVLNVEFRDPVTNIIIPLITYDIDVLLDGQSVLSERGRHTPDGSDRIPLHFAGPGAVIASISQVNDFETGGEFAFTVGKGLGPDGGGAGAAAHDHRVEMAPGSFMIGCERDDACFEPYALEALQGQTVSWKNLDEQGHTVASGTPGEGPDGMFLSPVVGEGQTYEYTFEDAGTFDYFCTLHPWMLGTVTIREGDGVGSGGGGEDADDLAIPDWIKSNARWWSDGIIDDATFASALEYLVREGIIAITDIPDPGPADAAGDSSAAIPDWIKSNARWWSDGIIDDATFAGAVEWMIATGVISL